MAKLDDASLPPDVPEDVTPDVAVPPELVAGSVSEYLRATWTRIKGGETGVLPVVGGLPLSSRSCSSRSTTTS